MTGPRNIDMLLMLQGSMKRIQEIINQLDAEAADLEIRERALLRLSDLHPPKPSKPWVE